MKIIQFKDVWEMYRIKFVIDGKVSWENFWALNAIDFDVEKGETVGIIGENGVGKSTVLRLIMGMLKPDRGEVKTSGRISGLLELGAGFQPELTGRENVYLNAGLFGLNQHEIEAIYPAIVNFAELGKFINAPVKCYSQGMFVRLAFSIAIHVNPDILLIDDTLAVGDEYFQKKCVKKILEIKQQGKTIILVTHDTGLLTRLCERAIFLKQGRIVKDDSTDKVVSFFVQTIGAKEGVAILKKGSLNIVFNNGHLFLNWKERLVTPGLGVYTILATADKDYNSNQADWSIIREEENNLTVIGKFAQLGINQIWELELDNNHSLKWSIEIDSDKSIEISECYTNIMLINEYSRWFTSIDNGLFPAIDGKNMNWLPLLDANLPRKLIGAEAKKDSDWEIPSLVFEQTSDTLLSSAQIFNTDYAATCRVLQYKTVGLNNKLLSFQASRHVIFSGKIILGIPDTANYLNNLDNNFVLSKGALRLVFANGRCLLSYNGLNLTKSSHMNSSIYTGKECLDSISAHWEVKKENKDTIIAHGVWPGVPITQVWIIEMLSDSNFLWKINLEVNGEINIHEQRAQLMCVGGYENYFSDYDSGAFLNDFLMVEKDLLQRCIPDGLIGASSHNNDFPAISLKFSQDLNNFAKIFNSDFYNKGRILRIEKVEPEENVLFSPGKYRCFEIEVNLNKVKQLHTEKLVNILETGKLKFIFDNGRGFISWNGKELTKKLGFYTSLRSCGRWHDSASSAIWKISERNDNFIKVTGRWLYLPIIQSWEIKLQDNGRIEFKIIMNVTEKISIDRLQTNLMLSEKYSRWLTEKEKGCFPLFKDDISDDWQQVCSVEQSKYIGVLKNSTNKEYLPQIVFSPIVLNPGWLLNVLNSDIYHRGRVLQYLNSKSEIIEPGEYSYAHGTISIEKNLHD